jgi:hypothetical protein
LYSRSTVLLLCIFISSDISFIIDVVGSIWYYDKDFADYAAERKDKNAAVWI